MNSRPYQGLSEKVCKLVVKVDKSWLLGLVNPIQRSLDIGLFVPDKMTINLYVFGPFMKHRVESYMKVSLILAIQFRLFNFTKFQLLKELFIPHKFTRHSPCLGVFLISNDQCEDSA